MNLRMIFALVAGLAAGAAPGCSRSTPTTAPLASVEAGDVAFAQAYDPVIRPEDFVDRVDNPFLPLIPGTTLNYVDSGGIETNEVAVLHDTLTILGVPITVVHDQVRANGVVTEDTHDWYAQNKDGTVWYFGEDTKTLDAAGNILSTEGSWRAGENGAKPGILMLAHPKVGEQYRQEYAPGIVADMGKVLSLKETATVPYGTFADCVETMEWTPLEPGDRAHKYYVRGIGPVLEESTRRGRQRLELVGVVRP
jgi:hypothetical protein